jgi:hypothetical protein
VIVWQGFELLNPARASANPNRVQRYEFLCRFLDRDRDTRPTVDFVDLNRHNLCNRSGKTEILRKGRPGRLHCHRQQADFPDAPYGVTRAS